MARIRTIKPEFPQSESMGRVSRDARLCFVLLWTLADDAGRLRGASRMLASLLFPYDDDAPGLIEGWLVELESVESIVRYRVGGDTYIEISKWLSHQKIDRPSASKIPGACEGSRIIARAREDSLLDQGSRIKDQGREAPAAPTPAPPAPPPVEPPADAPAPPARPRSTGMKTFDTWIAECGAAGVDPIPRDHAVFAYADRVGLPHHFLRINWLSFKLRHSGTSKKYIDWARTFHNAVKGGWFRLWWLKDDQYVLTTAGKQAEREFKDLL